MNPTQSTYFEQTILPPERHYRWLPVVALQPGMVIARPVAGLSGVLETMYLAIGSTITISTIVQLVTKGVECVAVVVPPEDDLQDDGSSVAKFEARLQEIFGTDPSEACKALINALMLARPTL